MIRDVVLLCLLMGFAATSNQHDDRFARYTALTAYQTGSGILVLPRYSNGGQICEVVLEKRHYFGNTVDLASTLPRDKIVEVLNEIVPVSERGRSTMPFATEYLSKHAGNSVTTFADYEAVSIQIYGKSSPAFDAGDVAARIRWKQKGCE